MRNLESGYSRIFGRTLPAVLMSNEIVALNIRPKFALDRDAINGVGLKPLSKKGAKGKPRKYLVTDAINYLLSDSPD